jgi:ribonuclease HII
MLLIATDEAGYGPKLGPLVIVASSGQINACDAISSEDLIATFDPMIAPVMIDQQSVRIDDSKSIYKSGTGLVGLHHVVSASHHWCGNAHADVHAMIQHVAAADRDDIAAAPWLGYVAQQPLTSPIDVAAAITGWQSAGFQLSDLQARVITANRFNQSCREGFNKADLLTQFTLGLVVDAIAACEEKVVRVFCDRHGGRRYYAAAIQQFFPDAIVRVISETSQSSIYQCDSDGRSIRIAFTVKGDRFAPVALASMHAKYIRERFMESLNAYFSARHQNSVPLKPTAGYPVDADRFLQQIGPILKAEKIARQALVRER